MRNDTVFFSFCRLALPLLCLDKATLLNWCFYFGIFIQAKKHLMARGCKNQNNMVAHVIKKKYIASHFKRRKFYCVMLFQQSQQSLSCPNINHNEHCPDSWGLNRRYIFFLWHIHHWSVSVRALHVIGKVLFKTSLAVYHAVAAFKRYSTW